MENKINIAEILRDMPKGTKLYSPLFGKCNLDEVCTSDRETYQITLLTSVDASASFTKNGHYLNGFEDTECLLFPSAKMRSWDKFFKHGDIVYNPHSQMYAVFECWANDDYTEFNTTINHYKDNTFGKEEVCDTECFVKANDEQKALFIAAAEKYYGGKCNPETLQVEPIKVSKPVCPFEPFQKVLVRDSCDDKWKADYFSHYDEDNGLFPYYCVGYCYKVCIAYEGNEHLLGTNNNPE